MKNETKSLQWKMESAVGPLYLVATEKGLKEAVWKRHQTAMALSLDGPDPILKNLRQAVRELTEYLKGDRKRFDIKLDVTGGTPFQRRVWQELAKIPYGKTISYKEIAARIERPRAIRAVGTANGKNPVSIIVPCHRVIAASGKLGGYAGGLKIKTKLLSLENS